MATGYNKQNKIKRQQPKVFFFMPALFVFSVNHPLGP